MKATEGTRSVSFLSAADRELALHSRLRPHRAYTAKFNRDFAGIPGPVGALVVVLALTIAPAATIANGNLVLNGDFENNTVGTTQLNLGNAVFNAHVPDATAFGLAQEIDFIFSTDFQIAPQSGNWKVGLHKQTGQTNDEFSLSLSSPLVVGDRYEVRFFGALSPREGVGPIQIGLSDSAINFGSLLFSATPLSTEAWTQFDYRFTATESAGFLTVRNENLFSANTYSWVDNISLTAVPEPATAVFLMTGSFAWFAFSQTARVLRMKRASDR